MARYLLTGSTGVLGRSLIAALAPGDEVIALIRGPRGTSGCLEVTGDVREPGLGLSPADTRLLDGVEAVLHCAALTGFNEPLDSYMATNLQGTRNIAALAAQRRLPVLHVSTAFIALSSDGGHGYPASKRLAEAALAEAGTTHRVVRPSILAGELHTGAMSRPQGLHQLFLGYLRGLVPAFPAAGTWRVDCVPQDVVANAIWRVVRSADWDGPPVWLTAGGHAPTVAEVTEEMQASAARHGVRLDPLRCVPPDTFDRLIAPVFLPVLPVAYRGALRALLALRHFLEVPDAFPSDLGDVWGGAASAVAYLGRGFDALAREHAQEAVRGQGRLATSRAAAEPASRQRNQPLPAA
ncbi:MAG: SDR family oxidoreductase [Actinobacteria bacterium]|nr:SDR family oxidoreductase [Actinomycetota bacterium]